MAQVDPGSSDYADLEKLRSEKVDMVFVYFKVPGNDERDLQELRLKSERLINRTQEFELSPSLKSYGLENIKEQMRDHLGEVNRYFENMLADYNTYNDEQLKLKERIDKDPFDFVSKTQLNKLNRDYQISATERVKNNPFQKEVYDKMTQKQDLTEDEKREFFHGRPARGGKKSKRSKKSKKSKQSKKSKRMTR
jgi:hypothetical protein